MVRSPSIPVKHYLESSELCDLVRMRDHLLLILDSVQHGFILEKSCVTQLVEVILHRLVIRLWQAD